MDLTNRPTRTHVSSSPQLKHFTLLIGLALVVAFCVSSRFTEASQENCAEAADLRVLLGRNLSTIAFPKVSTTVSGARSALIITTCPNRRRVEDPLPSFAWKFEKPVVSASRLQNTNTLRVSFTPDRVGRYVVKLIACPNTCKLSLLSGHTSTGKPIFEDTEIGPVERTITIDVAAEAQIPPLYTPTALPSLSAATRPEHYGDPRSHCGGSVGIGIGDSPQWYTTDVFNSSGTPPYKLVEGRVYHTLVSRKDHPASHNSNDTNALVEVDPPFQRLLVDDTAVDKGSLLPFGGLEVEWENNEWPEAFRPVTGDRISALGFLVIDCGHEKYTELHPPIAVAVHRPRAVVLPARVRFGDTDSQTQPTGTNVVVPGIVTDVWASLRGGQALDCENASLHQPVLTTTGSGVPSHLTCVKQPTTSGVNFEFNIYLPPNPADRLKEIGLALPVRPALFFDIQNHPEAAALGARSDIGVTFEPHPQGPTPFVKVRITLSQMKTGEKFAKRFVAAWVYPDYTSRNFGLRSLRVKLDELIVTNDGDPFLKGDGDWRFWAIIPSTTRPWTKLIDCNGCVEEESHSPRHGVFRPGAFDSEGRLTGEVFLFDRQSGSLQFTGFESDLLTSDDVGNVFEIMNTAPATRTVFSKCSDQTVGGLNDIDPSTSGCASYKVKFEFVPGRGPLTATLSPEMNKFAQKLLVRADDRQKLADVSDTELFTLDRAVEERSRLIVGAQGDLDKWQEELTTGRLSEQMRTGNSEPMVKDLRKHVQALLGPNPSEKHRRKIALELRELKKSVPPELYRKYLCDLETGRPCQ